MPSASVATAFSIGDHVLAVHGPMMYAAVILEVDAKPQLAMDPNRCGPYYKIHYKGWKDTWDEWVREPRLSKDDAKGQARKKQLATSHATKSKRNAELGKSAPKTTLKAQKEQAAAASRVNKRGRDATIEADEDWKVKPEIKLSYPDAAKVQLVDDWEAVTKEKKIVPLPKQFTVEEILAAYVEQSSTLNPPLPESTAQELQAGLLLFFNRSIDKNLIYRLEQKQLDELKKKHQNKELSAIYGAEHLLRLFVNLPELMAHSSMSSDSVSFLREVLQDFLSWLISKKEQYLLDPLTQYEAAPETWVEALQDV